MLKNVIKQDIIHDIFGRQNGEVFESGLCDADNAEEFEKKMLAQSKKWKKVPQVVSEKQEPKIQDYVKRKHGHHLVGVFTFAIMMKELVDMQKK